MSGKYDLDRDVTIKGLKLNSAHWLSKLIDLFPQTYGEAILIYPWMTIESHEWDNRTTIENIRWVTTELERQLAEKDAKLEELRESIDVCKDAYVFNMKEIAEKAAEIEKQNSNLLFYATENLKLKHRLRDIAYPPEY